MYIKWTHSVTKKLLIFLIELNWVCNMHVSDLQAKAERLQHMKMCQNNVEINSKH